MKRTLCILLFASSAFAQKIVSISPKLGSVGGGDLVTIKIEGMSLDCNEVCGIVYFGDTPATTNNALDQTTIQALTPKHAKGTVDVAVQSIHGQRATGAQFTFSGFGGDIERANYEVILIPVGVSPDEPPIAGLNGSQWRSSIWASNLTASPVEFFAGYPYCALLCAPCCMGTTPFPSLSGFELRNLSYFFVQIHTARLFYLQRGGAANVSFALRVGDVSRAAATEGTEIPVAREKDLHTVPFDLLDVLIDGASRTALRVYDVDARSDTVVTVNFYSMSDNRLVSTRRIGLVPPRTEQEHTSFPTFAGYAEMIDLGSMIAGLAPDRYRINISSNNAARLWAFASITNNSTQFVTVIAPN